MANSKKKKTSHRPTLAKIWWASVPFVFASQGLIAPPPEDSAAPNYSSFLWPVEDQEHTLKNLLQQDLEETEPKVAPGLHDPRTTTRPHSTNDKQMNLDWMDGQLPTSTRFQVPEDVVHACTSTQDCRFDSCGDSSYAPRHAYLRNSHLAEAACYGASSVTSAHDCQGCHPRWCSGPSCDSLSWINTTCVHPKALPERSQIPCPACESCYDSWYSQGSRPRAGQSIAWNASSMVASQVEGLRSSTPPLANAVHCPICGRSGKTYEKPVAYLTIVALDDSTILCPNCTQEAESHVPTLVTASSVISTADLAHGKGTYLKSQLSSKKPQLRSSVGTYIASAASPAIYNSNSCVGTECKPINAEFTPNFPTAARIAFNGTGHDSIEDFAHVVNFAYTEFVPTNPEKLCAIDRLGAPSDTLAALNSPGKVSQTFSQIASDRCTNPSTPSDSIARSGPDPRLVQGWVTVVEDTPQQPEPTVPAVIVAKPVTFEKQQSNWNVLDNLVADRDEDVQPILQIAREETQRLGSTKRSTYNEPSTDLPFVHNEPQQVEDSAHSDTEFLFETMPLVRNDSYQQENFDLAEAEDDLPAPTLPVAHTDSQQEEDIVRPETNFLAAAASYQKENFDRPKAEDDLPASALPVAHTDSQQEEEDIVHPDYVSLASAHPLAHKQPPKAEPVIRKKPTKQAGNITLSDADYLAAASYQKENFDRPKAEDELLTSALPVAHTDSQQEEALFTFSGRISARRGASDAAAADEGIALAIAEETNAADERSAVGRKLTEKVNKAQEEDIARPDYVSLASALPLAHKQPPKAEPPAGKEPTRQAGNITRSDSDFLATASSLLRKESYQKENFDRPKANSPAAASPVVRKAPQQEENSARPDYVALASALPLAHKEPPKTEPAVRKEPKQAGNVTRSNADFLATASPPVRKESHQKEHFDRPKANLSTLVMPLVRKAQQQAESIARSDASFLAAALPQVPKAQPQTENTARSDANFAATTLPQARKESYQEENIGYSGAVPPASILPLVRGESERADHFPEALPLARKKSVQEEYEQAETFAHPDFALPNRNLPLAREEFRQEEYGQAESMARADLPTGTLPMVRREAQQAEGMMRSGSVLPSSHVFAPSALIGLVDKSPIDRDVRRSNSEASANLRACYDVSCKATARTPHQIPERKTACQTASQVHGSTPYDALVGVQQSATRTRGQQQQLHVSAAPAETSQPSGTRKVPVTFEPLPGLASQEIRPAGQRVPNGLNIASTRTGAARTPPKDDLIKQIRSLHGGYFYYIGEGTNPTLSTSQDHLQTSGALKRRPGAGPDSDDNLSYANLHNTQHVGLRETSPRVQTTVALSPGIGDGRGHNKVAQRSMPPIEKNVSLTSTPKDTLTETLQHADLCTGKARCKVVKVVNSQSPQKRASQAGKTDKSARQTASSEGTDHRFSVDIVPRSDSAPTLKNIVGHPSKQRNSNQNNAHPSNLIEFAHASDGMGYEPTAFLSIGAPTHFQEELDDDELSAESSSNFSVGAVGIHEDAPANEWDFYEDSYTSIPEPGIEPHMTHMLGVRREGLISSSEPVEAADDWSDDHTAWEETVFTEHYEDQQPPDKWTPSVTDRTYSVASSEEVPSGEEETQVPSQKKNRVLETGLRKRDEGTDGISTDTASDIAAAEVSESVYKIAQPLQPSEDPAIAGWQNEWSSPRVAPLSSTATRDLDPRNAIDSTIAQETLFDSGRPAVDKKQPSSTDNKPSTEKKVAPAATEEEEPEGLLINFRDVAITEYIRFVSQQTNKNFIFNDDDLQFNITIISEKPTTIENIMAALLQELRIHGLRVIEQGNNIIIHKDDNVRGPTRVVRADQPDTGETEIVTRVFQLSSIPAEKMKEVVLPILSSQALVQVLPETNNLLITDFGINVSKIADLIHSLDKPTVAFEVGQYVGRNNFIENLIPLAEEIIQPFAEKQSIVFVPHLATNSVFIVANPTLLKRALGIFEHLDALEGATKILTLEDLTKGGSEAIKPKEPEKQTKEVETKQGKTKEELEEERRTREVKEQPEDLLGTSKGRANERQHVRQPQEEAPPQDDLYARTKFYIHKLQYRQGDQLQDALIRISDSLRQSENVSVELINAINSIQWIESSNALVITGTAEALGRVKELIDEIDVPLRQVYLEMLILDTNISDSLSYAVEITSNFKSPNVAGSQGFSGSIPQTGSGTGLVAPTAIIGAVNAAAATAADSVISAASLAGVATPGFNLGIIGRRILKGGTFFNTMGALVEAVHDDINAEIVLNPKIIVEDNNEAEIFVGENIAFQTQNVVNNEGTIVSQNFEFRDVGTTLKVRPQIGSNNIITLEIEQEVSSTITTQASGTGGGSASANISPGPSTSTSRTITKVHVPNEFFVVISGMIKDEKRKHRNQIPCLGGLPIIGAFGSREENTINKRNLMIFIRPQIIETEWDFDNLTKNQQNIYKDKGRRQPRWKYEADEGLEFLNLPRINERCEDDTYLPGFDDDSAPVNDY